MLHRFARDLLIVLKTNGPNELLGEVQVDQSQHKTYRMIESITGDLFLEIQEFLEVRVESSFLSPPKLPAFVVDCASFIPSATSKI